MPACVFVYVNHSLIFSKSTSLPYRSFKPLYPIAMNLGRRLDLVVGMPFGAAPLVQALRAVLVHIFCPGLNLNLCLLRRDFTEAAHSQSVAYITQYLVDLMRSGCKGRL